jgi:multiple sugar transport system permease protein
MAAADTAGRTLVQRWKSTYRTDRAVPWLFLVPAVILVLGIAALPILQALSYSLFRTTYLVRTAFVGLQQYITVFSDPSFYSDIRALLTFVFFSLAISIPVGTVAALILNEPIRFRIVFRTVLLLPWMLSQLVTALLWEWLANDLYGPLSYFIERLGFGHVTFLSDPGGAMAILVLANVWHTYGFTMILVLAALQTIPGDLYEAARCDGANGLQSFRWITLPLLIQTLLVAIIMQTLNDVNMVVLPLVLTGGGPFGATELLGVRVYKEAFENWNMGLASAISVIMFALNMVLTLVYIRALKRET